MLVEKARHVAAMVARWPLPMHVEEDDICSFIVSTAVLSRLRGGSPYLKGLAVEYLRSFGGDARRHRDTGSMGRPRNGRCTRFLHLQILPGFDPAGETDLARDISLRRCGLLMLRSLPQRLRRVIVLRYWHGMSGDEAARLMKISPSRLAQLQAEALGIIRDCLFERGISSIGDVM